jgi:hypothetical protein
VFASLKLECAFLALICIALGSTPNRATAVTVEVAKKCEALTAKAYPPREVGNPAECERNGARPARLFQQVRGERRQD